MASTIKLKNSTTVGNAPSSLETGEVAINVADGNLFYGSASAVKQHFIVDELEVKGNLTAQQYIVSSSVTYTTQSFSSGSTIFGDTQDDTHLFTGSISVTGSITATSFTGNGSGLTNLPSQTDQNFTTALKNKLDAIETSADVTDTANVTAAGALMDSELAEITTVKSLTAAGISGSFNAASASFSTRVTANDAKLTANTSNVTSAGALMDSELSEITTVKALTKAGISGSFNAASASFSTRVTANDSKVSYTDSSSLASRLNTLETAGYTTNTGTVDTTGTPADNQVAVFTDADTIEGSSTLLFENSILDIVSTNSAGQTVRIYGGVFGAVTPYITPIGSSTLKFGDGTSGHTFDFQNNKIAFDADATNTYIQADTSTPENIEVHADGNIELRADDNLEIHSPISTNITASGNISASGDIFCTNITIAEDITSVGDDIILKDNLSVSSSGGAIQFRGTAGGSNESITYLDSGGSGRFAMLFPGSDVVAITNRASNGTVEIRANSSTAGSSGEVTVAEFQDDTIFFNVAQRRLLEVTSTTDGDGNGDFIKLGSTSTTAGKIYYYNSSGNWVETDADAASSSTGLIAVAMSNNSSKGMLLKGMVTLDHDPGTVGDVLYLSTTAAQASSTAPSGTGDIVRVIGYCLNSTNGQIYFNPSPDHIVHA